MRDIDENRPLTTLPLAMLEQAELMAAEVDGPDAPSVQRIRAAILEIRQRNHGNRPPAE